MGTTPTIIPDPPLRNPITDVNGNITRPWYQFWKGSKDSAENANSLSVLAFYDGEESSPIVSPIDAALSLNSDVSRETPDLVSAETLFGSPAIEQAPVDYFQAGYNGERDSDIGSMLGLLVAIADAPQIPAIIPPTLYEDTHANRIANYAPSNYPLATLFRETDRNAIYEIELIGGANTWVYLPWAPMFGTTVSVDQRPAGLGANDAGFLFISTDGLVNYEWTGSLWELTSGVLLGLDASKPATLTANDAGFPYFASDTGIFYVWSGTAWKGTSTSIPLPPSFWYFSTSTSTLNTGGTTVSTGTLTKAGTWQITFTAQLNVIGSGDAGQLLKMQPVCAGAASGPAFGVQGADGTSGTVSVTIIEGGLSVGQSAAVTVSKAGGTGASTCSAASIAALWISA